jgi:hypothetical protein
VGAWVGPAAESVEPHSPQNLAPGELAVPHAAQTTARAAPHSPQNFRPSSFSVPHRWQRILASLASRGRSG